MSSESRPVVGYWAIRGLAQPIRFVSLFNGMFYTTLIINQSFRLLLAYTGTEFEDKMYQVGKPPQAKVQVS